ncbi:Vacuolar protein sorting-associated protein 8 [Beauveria asiatica]|uniref:Vacuolar protein sorting-associated protein 8 n=1 Tax=Beauveria asiatica TaxID=1069075 RepID=A0AAW0RYM6_9HYPO
MSASIDQEADYLSDDHSSSASSSSSSSSSSPPQRPAGPVPTNFFAPPFYGRPPTPLPPSPSLTSLLRPSRPTTPDASDDNDHQHARHHQHHRNQHQHHQNQHNHSHSHDSADGHHAGPPVPRAAPRVPTYEYYGFVLYLLSGLAFLAYLLWSYLPSPFLHGLGIYYYPDRWWALATPAYLVMTLVYIYVALASYNLEMLTLPLRRVETIVDDAGQLAVVDAEGKLRGSNSSGGSGRQSIEEEKEKEEGEGEERWVGGRMRWREVWSVGTDAVLDIPLSGVCEVLYGEGREGSDGEEDLWTTA